MSKQTRVAVMNADHYEPGILDERIGQLFALTGADQLISPGMNILIKPNLLLKRTPEEATTTHPQVVAAVVRRVKALGAGSVTIADSPGGLYTKQALAGIYEATGMAAAAKETGARLNDDFTFFEHPFPQGRTAKSFELITPVKQADLIISIAKMKTHCMSTLSGGVKNLFGCIPGLQKPGLHYRFPEKPQFCDMLIDLALAVAPAFTIVDGILAMEGNGPSGGTPKHVGVLAASQNPFALDLALCKIMNISPEEVYTVQNAIERGLCPSRPEELELVGDPLKIVKDYKKPDNRSLDFVERMHPVIRPVMRVIRDKLIMPKPFIDREKCVGCGKCAESCPPKTIRIVDKKAKIGYNHCIKCYCCHEMCPVRAIEIKRSRFF